MRGQGRAPIRTAARGAGSIESEELLEETGKFFWWNGVALVGEADRGALVVGCRGDVNFRIGPAVEDGVAQEIVEDAREARGIGAQRKLLRRVERGGEIFLCELWLCFEDELLEEERKDPCAAAREGFLRD